LSQHATVADGTPCGIRQVSKKGKLFQSFPGSPSVLLWGRGGGAETRDPGNEVKDDQTPPS